MSERAETKALRERVGELERELNDKNITLVSLRHQLQAANFREEAFKETAAALNLELVAEQTRVVRLKHLNRVYDECFDTAQKWIDKKTARITKARGLILDNLDPHDEGYWQVLLRKIRDALGENDND